MMDKKIIPSTSLSQSVVDDLLSMGLGDVFNNPPPGPEQPCSSKNIPNNDPWLPQTNGGSSSGSVDVYPSLAQMTVGTTANDPWSPPLTGEQHKQATLTGSLQNFTEKQTFGSNEFSHTNPSSDPWSVLDSSTGGSASRGAPPMIPERSPIQFNDGKIADSNGANRPNSKTPESFLGENSVLVNLDNLMGHSTRPQKTATNPFLIGSSASSASSNNPFMAQQRPSPSLNEMLMMQTQLSSTSTNGEQQKQQQHPPPSNPFS